MVKVNIKWGKEKFPDVELDISAPVELFKAQLFALTSVPVDRQKIMGVKGGTLKDDADLSALGIKDGQNLMLMGSAEKAPEPPPVATVFAEDMPAIEVASMETENPGGLSNLGNTCYLNSTLQCMKAIPEFNSSLKAYTASSADDAFVMGMRSIITELEGSNAAREIKPFSFVQTFRTAFPMFATRTDDGRGFVQQDAEECWSTIISALSQRMTLSVNGGPTMLSPPNAAAAPVLPRMTELRRNLGDMLFGIEMESSYKCLEGEEAYTVREAKRSIQCYISEKTAHLYTALDVNLDETIDKHSAILEREASYSKRSRLARLPPILAVQFVRFAYRKDTGKRAKILRNVSFPPMLDVRNLCTKDLQASIAAHCTALEEERDAKLGASKAPAPAASTDSDAPMPPAPPPPAPAADAAASSAAASGADAMNIEPLEPPKSKEELQKLAADAAGAECNDNRTGRYEHFAVVTHQGRTAEGGHYVAWVKKDAKKWLVFDDETVAEVDAERIKELYGGGDWHMAYMCFYRKMDVLTLDDK